MNEETKNNGAVSEKHLLNALLNISSLLLNGDATDEVLRLIVKEVQALSFDRLRLYLPDEDGRTLRAVAHAGMGAGFDGAEWQPPDNPLIQSILRETRPRLWRFQRDAPGSSADEAGAEDADETAYLPLRKGGRLVGLVSADNARSRRPVGEDGLRLLSLLAPPLIAAIEHRSVAEARQRAQRLQAILNIYSNINLSLSVEQTFQTACQAAASMTGADHSGLVIFDEGLRQGRVRAEYPDLGLVGLEIPLQGVEAEERLLGELEPLVVSDVAGEESFGPVRDILLDRGINSILIVPIIGKAGPLGSFSLDTLHRSRLFTDEEVNLCKAFAAQVAVAIENARLYEEERLWSRRLETLGRTTLDITEKPDRQKLLQAIIARAVGLLDGVSGGIYEYYPERRELSIVADHRRNSNVGKTLKAGEGMAGRLVLEGAPPFLTVADYNSWPGRADIYAEGRPFGAVIAVPLKWHDQVTGVLYVDDAVGRVFGQKDAHLLRLFADQAAVALANAALAASNEAKLKKIGLLSRAAGEFLSDVTSESLDARLDSIARWATQILDAEVCGIFLVDEQGQLSLEAGHGHAKGGFTRGLRLRIHQEPGGGLTGYIAGTGELFNKSGAELLNDPAVKGDGHDFLPSGECTALLAIPLKKNVDGVERVVGLLRIANKLGADGRPQSSLRFTEEDEWILRVLADAVVLAIDNAAIVEQLKRQRDDLGEQKRHLTQVESRLAMLLKAGEIVAQADSLDRGLQNLSEMVVSLLSHSFCRILLIDEGRTSLVVNGACSIERSGAPFEWQPNHGKRMELSEYPGLKEFLDEGRPAVVHWSNPQMQPHLRSFSKRLGLTDPVRSLLMVPLKIGDEVIGLLSVGEIRRERSALTKDTIALASDIAAQIGILVRRLWHYERRRTLLHRLGNAARSIMGKYDRDKIHQEAATLAVGLIGYAAGGLFLKHARRRQLELCAEYQLGLEPGLKIPYDGGLLCKVARTGESRVVHGYAESAERDEALAGCKFQTVIAVPLKSAVEVTAVLLVGERTDRRVASEAELEVLERFAEHASIALQTSQLIGREPLLARYKHPDVLHQISDYVMTAQDVGRVFDVVLTGITAGYGLGFNRAAVFLLDEFQENLVGYKGIGHLDRREAVDSWEEDHLKGRYDLNVHLEELERGAVPPTPVETVISGLRLPVGGGAEDVLARAVRNGESEGFTVAGDSDALPEAFRAALRPTSTVVVVPLSARGRPIGLIVADNEFSRAPIDDNDVGALMTFANTAALAVDNIRLLQRLQEGHRKLRSLFTASTALSTSREPRQVLKEITEQTRIAARAASVAIALNDELGGAHALAAYGEGGDDGEGSDADATPPADIEFGGRFEPSGVYHLLGDGAVGTWQSTDGAEIISRQQLSLPLSLHGKMFGRMSINYDQPRTFSVLEIDALQLYVNHAAVAYDSARRMGTLNHMRRAAEAMAGAADARGVLEQIVLRARAALEADSAAIWIYDAGRNSFVNDGWVANNIDPALREEFWKVKPSAAGTAHTVMERGSVSVSDVRDESAHPFLGERTRGLLGRIGVRSFLGVSLRVGAEPLGVLYINFGRPRQFSEEEKRTASTFATHAALSLKRARLLEQVLKAKKAAEAVARVMVLGNREETLLSIAEETKRALDCDIVVLYEYDKDSRSLRHPPTTVGLDDEGRRKAMKSGVVERDSLVYWMLEKEKPYIVERVEEDPMFWPRRFAREERVRSCVGVPIRMQEQKLGVMFVNYRMTHKFTADELDNVVLFSNQAAVAIRNAQLFDARNLQLRQQGELIKFSQELLGIVSLQETMDQAARIAADILGVEFCAIVLPDETGDLLVSAVYGWPEEMVGRVRLKSDTGSQSGLTIQGRAPVAVEDYRTESRFDVPEFVLEHDARSGVSVPMFVRDEAGELSLVGVMLLHSRARRLFSEEDQGLLSLIANDTAVAIQRTRQYEELKTTRWRIGARTALAWMGMVNNYYQHTIVGHGNTINSRLELIRAEERKRGPDEKLPEWVGRHLVEIADNATKIVERPITPPLSSEEGLADVHINELLSERLAQLWVRNPYKEVRLALDLDRETVPVVRISSEWLRRALDILIDNAVKEMQKVPPERRELTVGTRAGAREVEITLLDRGRGFPKEVEDKIFKGKIEKQADTKGLGMGLLMAQAIIETYGGKLDIKATGPDGTLMGIWLPLAPRQKDKGGAQCFSS